ncbi:iron-containing alcohol dehydrogenase [Fluviicola taffensis]|uniref:Alcohol dehydrogenase (NADP(+)) n=1 Tax=Fluviicola taffensis (strain DSM 16823 / NCIMB 13979 / RW262) TaxID=755732 RepID=F2IHJ2_FLUTR|nr:iron-containing alcohol dehydrogenase [Fluviicola taffensis]AEA43757.1 Alcohol dehydrogenase (NADP(+)) [Fluviicola taffensis DSM 16823]
MNNFEITTPTTIVFGKDQLTRISQLLKTQAVDGKVIVLYGGGSIEKSGFLDKLKTELADLDLHFFKGIEANPEFTTLMKAVEYIREHQIGYMLAVGGGSVIDGAKFISGAVNYGGDPWDVLTQVPGSVFTSAVPFGCILTIPATGSESNSGAVISRSELKEKRTMGGPLFFPKFALLDPTFVATLPKRQIANGVIDAYTHTMEQYLTFTGENLLQERYAEGILSTLIEIGEKVLENPADYELAANLMWCANQALNGVLRCGVTTDWATHMIGHELTALHGIDHAQSLAIIAPRLYEVKFESKKAKLTQYGQRVWNLEGSDDQVARKAIAKTEEFFHKLSVKTRISEYTSDYQDTARIIHDRFVQRGWLGLGEKKDLTPKEAEYIVNQAI